jgi:hypothetical protein
VLKDHPEITLPHRKETNYFSKHVLTRDLDFYEEYFDPKKKIAGEISPIYCKMKAESVRALHRLLPDLRIVLIIREPVERAFKQTVFELCRLGGRELDSLSVGKLTRHAHRERTARASDYPRMIEAWEGAFGDQVLVETYDHLRDDPAHFLDAVLRHIGADPGWEPPPGVVEKTVGSTAGAVKRTGTLELPPFLAYSLARRYDATLRMLEPRFGEAGADWRSKTDAWLAARRPGWDLFRLANAALRLPERIAYGVYDRNRDRRLTRRYAELLAERDRLVKAR